MAKIQYLGAIVIITEWWVVVGNFGMGWVTAASQYYRHKKSPGNNCTYERKGLQ